MNQPKMSPLFKAVKHGDTAKLRELLASGEPVDPQDHERNTPLMRAAESGNAEAFHALIEAGADVHALGMQQADVLEAAAEGGNLEIMSHLLDKGLPIEGHWQPRTEVTRRMGHMTPLFQAAINGRVDAVRLLLKRGANPNVKFDDKNMIAHTKDMASLHKLDGELEEEQNCRAVIALLRTAQPIEAAGGQPTLAQEVAKFAAAAKQVDYQNVLQDLEQRLGKSSNWQPAPDHGCPDAIAHSFTRRACKSSKELEALIDEVAAAGFSLVFSELWAPGEDAKLVLFPTSNPLAVVTATGTEGANYGVAAGNVTEWLSKLGEKNPFRLRYCGIDMVGGLFLGPLKQAKQVAEQMIELCPCCLDEGFDSAEELAQAMKKHLEFLLRWD
jgi:hypothetical protein